MGKFRFLRTTVPLICNTDHFKGIRRSILSTKLHKHVWVPWNVSNSVTGSNYLLHRLWLQQVRQTTTVNCFLIQKLVQTVLKERTGFARYSEGSYASIASELAVCGIYGLNDLCIIGRAWSSGEQEARECEPKPVKVKLSPYQPSEACRAVRRWGFHTV
jgi:hypothetical protein